MDQVVLKAYGKVNLGLDVTGRRSDGYHLVRMVMQTVDVYDEITVSRNEKGAILLTCNDPDIPTDERNLAFKAAAQVCGKYGLEPSVSIDIRKRIPAAAGMAGGSADGAAVIIAMDHLFELHMTAEEMDETALKLGADVPFCLRKGTYLAEGIGEKLTKLTDLAHCYMIIVKPDFGVSTPWAYKALDEYLEESVSSDRSPDGKCSLTGGHILQDRDSIHPDIDRLTDALDRRDISAISAHMGNILEVVVARRYPEITDIENKLYELGACKAMMSGSGPTVFGIFTDRETADNAFLHLGKDYHGKFKVEF